MAILLAVATVLSSQAFTYNAYASTAVVEESAVETSVESSNGESEEVKESETSEVEGEEAEVKEDSSKKNSDSEESKIEDSGKEDSIKEDSTKEELKDDDSSKSESEDAEIVEEKESDDEEEAESVEEEEKSADKAKDELSKESEDEEVEALDAEELEEDDSLESAEDYFERIPVLTLKAGAKLAPVVTVPKEVTTIGDNIFKNNSIVKKVKFEEGSKLKEIEADAFSNSGIEEIIIPANAAGEKIVIGASAFKDSKLKSIEFYNDTLETVEAYAFSGTDIETISLGKCTEIKENAFADCVYLKTINIPNLEIIGKSAFSGCVVFDDWNDIPISVRKIGSNAFRNCGLTTVDLSAYYYDEDKKETVYLSNLSCKGQSTDLTVYDDYEKVGSHSSLGTAIFANNTKLTTVSLPTNNVNFEYLPARTFEGCTALKTVNVNDKLKVIGDNAFERCTALKDINLVNVQFINSEAFKGCSSLATVTMLYKDVNEITGKENSHISIRKNAFPEKTGVTLVAYDSYVQEYADDMNGYTFKSLYTNHITLKGTIKPTLSNANPKPGEEVIVSVPDGESSFLKEIYYTYKGSRISPSYLGTNGGKLEFSFLMPDENIDLVLDAISANDLKYKRVIPSFTGGTLPDGKNFNWKWKIKGCSSTIKIDGMSNWLFDFKSDNEDIATVTTLGLLTGIEKGTANITITPKYNKSAVTVLTIEVGEGVPIGQVYVGQGYTGSTDKKIDPAKLISVGAAGEVSVDTETGYPVVTFNKNMVAKSSQTITINIKAYQFKYESEKINGFANEVGDTSSTVKAYWSSTDTSIATVAKATTTDNRNVITVKKGSSGESQIAVYTLNKDEKEPNQFYADYADNIGHVIIRVVDITPRLVETKLNVNHQLVKGTPITVIPVYGYDILDDEGLYIAKKKTVSGITSYYKDKDTAKFDIVDGLDGHWYIRTTNSVTLAMNKTEKYSKGSLYLCGYYKDLDKGEFQIPLPELTISNTVPMPKITQTGSINMFYNHTAGDDELGTVKITQSLTDYRVDKYELVSAQNYKQPSSETDNGKDKMKKGDELVDYDSLAYNFDIAKDEYNNAVAVINRSKFFEDLAVVNNKVVVAGYLYVYFAGYKTPSKIALTIKTTNVAPTYYLNMTSAVSHVDEINQSYELWLYKKGDPKDKKVSLLNTYDDKGNKYVHFDNNKGATTGNFALDYLQSKLNENILLLKVPEGAHATAGKSVIKVHMTTWSDPEKYLAYTFTLSTTNKLTAKLSATNKNLNKAWVCQDDDDSKTSVDKQQIDVKASTDDAYIYKVDIKGKLDNQAYNTLRTLITTDVGTNNITEPARIYVRQATKEEGGAIPNGKYEFSVTPYAKFNNNAATTSTGIPLPVVKFTVTVIDKKPTISVGAITFNSTSTVTKETPTSAIKLANMIDGTLQTEYSLDVHDALYTKDRIDNTNDDFNDYIVALDYNTGKLKSVVTAKKMDTYVAGKYAVSKVKAVSLNGAIAEVANYTVEFRNNTKAPAVEVKAKGSINMIRPLDTIMYTATVKNVVGTISGVGIRELDSNGKYIDSRFKIATSPDNTITYLSVRDDWKGEDMVPNKNYKVILCYSISSMKNAAATGTAIDEENCDCKVEVNVKPTVTFPKVTATMSKNYAYAGQDKQNTNWYIDVDVQVDNNFRGFYDVNGNKKYEPALGDRPYLNVAGIDWASTMTKAVKDEFEIIDENKDGKPDYTYDPVTGRISFKFKLRNASEQLQNKKYKLLFTTLYKELQVKDLVKGPNATVEVTINK